MRLASALVAASFAAGSPAFAQYAPSGQPYTSQYVPAYQPVYTQQASSQAANQSDEQLLTIGRLLEQEGRYAQAQRIYTELERRRMTGGQQQPAATGPNAAYQPQGSMAPQSAAYPPTWQAPPSQYASQAPVMDLTPQNNAAYGQRPEMVASQVPAAAPLPPPAPPSEAYVVDTQVTPLPKTTAGSDSQGWRSAIAPLPAALRAWNSDRPTPSLEQSSTGRMPTTATNRTDSASLPDLPIAPVAPLNSFVNQFPGPQSQAVVNSEPQRFLSPSPSSGDRRGPTNSGQEIAAPSEMRLSPMPKKNLDSLEAERETSQRQSDAIRIIPGQRAPLQLKPESGNLVDPREQPENLSAVEPPQSGLEPKLSPSQPPWEQQAARNPKRVVVENPHNFDLAAWVATPEFREIHTAEVLAGLDLLARSEPRYRAQGAIRIAAAGELARTALPVLRRVLASEADTTVRLRIAETVLKLQPNDRRATECLAEILASRNESELRQAAASALGGAATGRNPIAIASLTDALDDASPRVRAASAASLGLFGRAAADSVSKLENAAINDIPSVQQAAATALASIRGVQSGRPTAQSSAPTHENPFSFDPLNSTHAAPIPGAATTGRALLSDRLRTQEARQSDSLDDDSVSLPPKLFPANRPVSSRVLTPALANADDDAVPVSATAPEAPSRPFTTAPTAAFPPLQWDSTQTQALPAADATSAAPAAVGTFILQSEAGAAKASSKP